MTPESRALGDGCFVVHDQQHIILRTINGEGMVSNVIYLNKSVFLELVDHGITAFRCRHVVHNRTKSPKGAK